MSDERSCPVVPSARLGKDITFSSVVGVRWGAERVADGMEGCQSALEPAVARVCSARELHAT